MISRMLVNLFPPTKPKVSASPPPKPPQKPSSQVRTNAQDLLSHVEIDLAKLSADLSSRRPSDPNRPIIEAVQAGCEKIKKRIKSETRSNGDLEGFSHLLAFYESIPKSLRQIQVGQPLCPSREQFASTLQTLGDSQVKDVSQLEINLNFNRMAYNIPSFPNPRKYAR
jgi:hypothetical protein